MKSVLEKTFLSLVSTYTKNERLAATLWAEITHQYSEKGRYYHTLNHLDYLLSQLLEIKEEICQWETILFTLYYHDIVYDPSQTNNEEQSAVIAEKRLRQITVPQDITEICKQQIIATQFHTSSDNSDTNYFTDADLSILGQPWHVYRQYAEDVRKEYGLYTDSIYYQGRKQVLQRFLSMDRIFKTDHFFNAFEVTARENLRKEIDLGYVNV